MMKNFRPQFKPGFRCEILPSEGVFLLSETENFRLIGATYTQLAPFLNGQHTLTDLIALLQNKLSPLEIFYSLTVLQSEGYVVDADDTMPLEQAAFWHRLNFKPEIARQRLQTESISVVAFGNVETRSFETVLQTLDVRLNEQSHYWVVLTDDYLQDGLERFNQEALQQKRAWLLMKPVGTEIWIGPLFIPGKTACWECLKSRLQGHRPIENYLRKHKTNVKPLVTSLSVLPSTWQTALNLAATETLKWLVTGENKTLENQVVTLNTLTLDKRDHLLIRRPQCPCCGDSQSISTQQFAPLILQSQNKSFTTDGGHRSRSPEQTFDQFAHHISPITGIIRDFQKTSIWEEEQELTPSYVSLHNFDNELFSLAESLRSRAYGKGKQAAQAKVSALCEAIERYAGVFQGDEARVRAKLTDLKSQAIHPNACMCFSQRQFEQRDKGNRYEFNWVPEPFREDDEIEWSPVWSLTYNEQRYVPTAYCYYNYSQKHDILFTFADSNGCAAGNNKEEAILQGLLELVERDSVALWWYNRVKKAAVDLASFNEPYFQTLLDYYQQLHRDLWVLDLTSDLNIPAFVAVSRRNDQDVENILLGFGAHFDPQLAILRALTELNQSLPAVFLGFVEPKESSFYQTRDSEEVKWWQTATIKNHPYLLPDETLTPKTQTSYSQDWSDDLYIDIMNGVKLLQTKGLETLVLDQTRPDLGLQVVKVIVPGLRHFWPRLGPGRLYDVPVQMGWLTEPLGEEQLNPQPAFF